MESFPMCNGTVTYIEEKIMFVDFLSPHEKISVAVAVNDVCFVGNCLSRNLCHDFRFGDKVMISAVKDCLPGLWQAVCVWTQHKPPSSFTILEWDRVVSKLYASTRVLSEINLFMERRIVKTLYWKIQSGLNKKSRDRDNLSALIDSQHDSNYIEKTYGSVSNYIEYHCPLFEISRRGFIYIVHLSKNNLENYLQLTLPKRLLDDNEKFQRCGEKYEEQDSGEAMAYKQHCVKDQIEAEHKVQSKHNELNKDHTENAVGNSDESKKKYGEERQPECNNQEDIKNVYKCQDEKIKNDAQHKDNNHNCDNSSADVKSKILKLEKESVAYFSEQIKLLYIINGSVFRLSNEAMDRILNNSPGHIRIYIEERYNDFRDFLHFHNFAFTIDHSGFVRPPNKKNMEEYLSRGLKELMSHDDRRTKLYDRSTKQNEVPSKNPIKIDCQRSHSSDNKESGHLENPIPENVSPTDVQANMDSFHMRNGAITYIGKMIMFVDFLSPYEGKSVAMAVNDVCFFGNCLSRNLDHDFKIGDEVMLSAVRDSNSTGLWQAVCFWTTHRPSSSFTIPEWGRVVSKLYTSTRVSSEMNLYMERGIVKTLYWKIQNGQDRKSKHRDNISTLIDSQHDTKYIEKNYGSVSNYIEYFCPMFEISKKGFVYISRQPKNGLENCLQRTLPERILYDNEKSQRCGEKNEEQVNIGAMAYKGQIEVEDNVQSKHSQISQDHTENYIVNVDEKYRNTYKTDEWSKAGSNEKSGAATKKKSKSNYKCKDGKGENNAKQRYDNKNCDSLSADINSEPKIFKLEKDAVAYFSSRINALYNGYVFRPVNEAMEKRLNKSPSDIQMYIRKRYRKLRLFLLFHKSAFTIPESGAVFSPTKKQLNEYLSNGIKNLMRKEDFNFELYNRFMEENGLIGNENPQSEGSNVKCFQKSLPSKEIHRSDVDECRLLEKPAPLNLLATEVQRPETSAASAMKHASTPCRLASFDKNVLP